MSELLHSALKAPRNIDFYFYAAGAGGEFFASLAARAKKSNHRFLDNKHHSKNPFKHTDDTKDIITFDSPNYFMESEKTRVKFSNIGYNFFKMGDEFSNPEDRILYVKMVLFHYLLSFKYNEDRSFGDLSKFYDNTTIIIPTHWMNYGIVHSDKNGIEFKNFKKRKLGIHLFEKQEYWGVVNIDPQTDRGKKFIRKWCKEVGQTSRGVFLGGTSDYQVTERVDQVIEMMNHSAFQNIKLKFPFMDYMIEKDYDSIKYWLEDRYGSDLDFDFIDQSLVNYRKIRIDPWL